MVLDSTPKAPAAYPDTAEQGTPMACLPKCIDICIPTYKRPALLQKLFQSLSEQQLPQGISTRWIVVDNDAAESARPVAAAALAHGWPVEYHTQPKKNISLTRNAALAATSSDLIAFIDDDEVATPQWLGSLLNAMRAHDADAVFGPVQGVLPPGTPAWIDDCGAFHRSSKPTGTRVPFGGAGNVLLKAALLPERANAFDPDFGLTGGEDTELFDRLSRGGAKLIWCQEALATEPVPPERMSARWILRREFRAGQSYADVMGRPRSIVKLIAWVLYRMGLALLAAALATVSLLRSRGLALRWGRKVASNVGQLSSLQRMRLQEYGPASTSTSST